MPSRKVLIGLSVLVLLLFGGWTIAWFFVASMARASIAAWFDGEREQGREWECGDVAFSGFPFRVDVRCPRPGLALTGEPTISRIAWGGLRLRADIFQLGKYRALAMSPLTIDMTNGRAIEARWTIAEGELELSNGEARALSLSMTGPLVSLARSGARLSDIGLDSASVSVRRNEDSDRLHVEIAADGVASRDIDAITGIDGPARLAFAADVSKIEFLIGLGWPAGIDYWRRAGGVFELRRGRIEKSTSYLDARGTASLDEERRAKGEVTVAARNPHPLLRAAGAPEGIVTAFFGPPGDMKAPEKSVSFKADGGRIWLGVLPLPMTLPPLY